MWRTCRNGACFLLLPWLSACIEVDLGFEGSGGSPAAPTEQRVGFEAEPVLLLPGDISGLTRGHSEEGYSVSGLVTDDDDVTRRFFFTSSRDHICTIEIPLDDNVTEVHDHLGDGVLYMQHIGEAETRVRFFDVLCQPEFDEELPARFEPEQISLYSTKLRLWSPELETLFDFSRSKSGLWERDEHAADEVWFSESGVWLQDGGTLKSSATSSRAELGLHNPTPVVSPEPHSSRAGVQDGSRLFYSASGEFRLLTDDGCLDKQLYGAATFRSPCDQGTTHLYLSTASAGHAAELTDHIYKLEGPEQPFSMLGYKMDHQFPRGDTLALVLADDPQALYGTLWTGAIDAPEEPADSGTVELTRIAENVRLQGDALLERRAGDLTYNGLPRENLLAFQRVEDDPQGPLELRAIESDIALASSRAPIRVFALGDEPFVGLLHQPSGFFSGFVNYERYEAWPLTQQGLLASWDASEDGDFVYFAQGDKPGLYSSSAPEQRLVALDNPPPGTIQAEQPDWTFYRDETSLIAVDTEGTEKERIVSVNDFVIVPRPIVRGAEGAGGILTAIQGDAPGLYYRQGIIKTVGGDP